MNDATPSRRRGPHPLLRAAGVDPAEAIRWGETGRYGIFGALVLFTTAMSASVALWAVTIATDAPLPVAIGIAALWGYGIFHVDRWLVATHVEHEGIRHRLWLLAPRLAIAVPMGLLVAWFAMLGVADKEINQQLESDRIAAASDISQRLRGDSDLARQRAELVQRKAALERDFATAAARIAPLQKAYDDECAGTGGTRAKGCGPAARRKLAELTTAQDTRDQAKARLDDGATVVDAAVARIDRRISTAVAAASAPTRRNDGVFARRAALSRVLERDADARRLYRLLEIVLVTIDIVPALAKVLSPVSMVDVARTVRRRRAKEELEAAAAAERESADIAVALAYAASQRAAELRDEATAAVRAERDSPYRTGRVLSLRTRPGWLPAPGVRRESARHRHPAHRRARHRSDQPKVRVGLAGSVRRWMRSGGWGREADATALLATLGDTDDVRTREGLDGQPGTA